MPRKTIASRLGALKGTFYKQYANNPVTNFLVKVHGPNHVVYLYWYNPFLNRQRNSIYVYNKGYPEPYVIESNCVGEHFISEFCGVFEMGKKSKEIMSRMLKEYNLEHT